MRPTPEVDVFGKTRESQSPAREETERRYPGLLRPGQPRERNAAMRALLAANEIDLSAERDQVRGVVERVRRLFGGRTEGERLKQEKLILRNTKIRYIDIRRKPMSMPYVRLFLTSDLSQEVAEAMGWRVPGDGITDGSLSGDLACNYLILTPNAKGLAEIQIDCSQANDFTFCVIADKDSGTTKNIELRYTVLSNAEMAAAKADAYWRQVAESDSVMKLVFTRQPVQQSLTEAPAESTAAEAKPADPDDEFANADQPGSPALASQMEMSGKRRGKVVQ